MSLPHDGDDVGHHAEYGQGRQLHVFPTSSQSTLSSTSTSNDIQRAFAQQGCMVDATLMHNTSRIGHAIITHVVFGS
jgi:hypothetical protein